MLDDLIKANKVAYEDAEIYQLFRASDLGQKWLSKMMFETFMEQPPPESVNKDIIVFIDGRRSLLRQINHSLQLVEKAIKEFEHEYGAAERPTE